MRLLKWELKKIWRPGILLGIAIISAIYGYLFISYTIESYNDPRNQKNGYTHILNWSAKYGTTMDDAERADAELELPIIIAKIDDFIKNDERFSKVGVYSYEDWRAYNPEEEHTKEESRIRWIILDEETNFLGFQLQNLENSLKLYDSRYNYTLIHYPSGMQGKRASEVVEQNLLAGIFPSYVFDYREGFITYGMNLMLLSLIIFLAPPIVRDHLQKMPSLQWSTHRGRSMLKAQFIAIMVSGALLALFQIVVLSAAYATVGTQVLWHNPIMSFAALSIFWLNLTYGQYLIATVLCAFCLALITSAIAKHSQQAYAIPVLFWSQCGCSFSRTVDIARGCRGRLHRLPLDVKKRKAPPVGVDLDHAFL